eukprot:9468021-Pyramimonas_sp.AAC.1
MVRANRAAHGEAMREPQPEHLPKRPRRELIDDIQRIVTVTVKSENNVNHEVRVLTHFLNRGRLSMELTAANISLCA